MATHGQCPLGCGELETATCEDNELAGMGMKQGGICLSCGFEIACGDLENDEAYGIPAIREHLRRFDLRGMELGPSKRQLPTLVALAAIC